MTFCSDLKNNTDVDIEKFYEAQMVAKERPLSSTTNKSSRIKDDS
jgi:hypothetical protein